MRASLFAAALGFVAIPALAQTPPNLPKEAPGKPDPALARAGTYQIEPSHTQIGFLIDHMGFTPFAGVLSQASGSLTLDPARPAASKLSVTVPIASIQTTSKKLDEELVSAQFFDVAKFPTASFTSTAVRSTGPTTAEVTGTLTLHGVAKPITLAAKFYGAGTNFMTKKPSIGFTANATLKRSEFGLTAGIPLVGDTVTLTIAAAFDQ
ncbi:MAG: YceI family protein [Sphingomonadaceae bacterium]|nr:YceI family protein [Sphingomonadaceae bacterium]